MTQGHRVRQNSFWFQIQIRLVLKSAVSHYIMLSLQEGEEETGRESLLSEASDIIRAGGEGPGKQ